MLKGGSLGIYGDFLFSEATQHGQSPVASVMGPVIGLGESMFNLTRATSYRRCKVRTRTPAPSW